VSPLGITEKRLRSALASGQITRLRHGVYIAAHAVPEDPVHLHLLRALAEQVAAPGRVASHETAALALGLPHFDTDRVAAGPVHLTRPASASDRSRTSSDRRIHLGSLPVHHVVTLPSGLVVTAPARTALDVAAGVPLPVGLMIADAAARLIFADLAGSLDRRHYDNSRLRAASLVPLMEAVAHIRVPGASSRLLDLLALVDVRRESPLESFSSGHMHLAGLPVPQLQVRVRTAAGSYHVDFRWEKYRVIGEADGEGKYRDAGEFVREKERERHLRDAGNDVVRWTGREAFRTPRVVMERIMRALVAGGWTP
jgi:very-short-patch-repair endonuclease